MEVVFVLSIILVIFMLLLVGLSIYNVVKLHNKDQDGTEDIDTKRKKSVQLLVLSIIFTVIVIGVCIWIYIPIRREKRRKKRLETMEKERRERIRNNIRRQLFSEFRKTPTERDEALIDRQCDRYADLHPDDQVGEQYAAMKEKQGLEPAIGLCKNMVNVDSSFKA